MRVRVLASLVAVILLGGLAGGCAHDKLAVTHPSESQTIGPTGIMTLRDFGKLGGQSFILLTTLRLNPREGHVEVCGASQVLARSDLGQKIAGSLAAENAALTLTSEEGGLKVLVLPQFLAVSYKYSENGKFNPREIGPMTANCVVTDAPWDERWSNLQFHGQLMLGH